MDAKSTWIPTWHRMVMFHGHLDYLQNHFLEIDMTQNWEITGLQILPNVDLFYSIMVRDPHE